jgi:hypothetical protein
MKNQSIKAPLASLRNYVNVDFNSSYNEFHNSKDMNIIYSSDIYKDGYINMPDLDSEGNTPYYFYQEVRKRLEELTREISSAIDDFTYSNSDPVKRATYFKQFVLDLEKIKMKVGTFKGEKIQEEFNFFFDIIFENIPINEIEESEPENKIPLVRQVLAVNFLLKQLGVNKDKTTIAEFIRYITGKGDLNTKIQHTNIYTFLIRNKPTVSDLQDLRLTFNKLGMDVIVSEIDEEIKQLSKPRK